MPSRSKVIRCVRSILSKGLMGLGVLWILRVIWPSLALIVFFVGLTVAVGIGMYRIWRYQQQCYQAQLRYEDRLARQFYALVQRREGRVSALEFAMYGRIKRSVAQRYLHEQAQAFGAYFERTLNGDIIYIFNLGMIFGVGAAVRTSDAAPSVAMTPAEMAWAYVEEYVEEEIDQMQPLPTMRGRAQVAPKHIKTIDVPAVNE